MSAFKGDLTHLHGNYEFALKYTWDDNNKLSQGHTRGNLGPSNPSAHEIMTDAAIKYSFIQEL